jgi:hypothetical protein
MTNVRHGADALNPAEIPSSYNSEDCIVLGYDEWNQSDWDRFAKATKVRIAQNASQTGLQYSVLDVERYAATIEQAPGWLDAQAAIGARWKTVYCDQSNLAAVREACRGRAYYIWLAWWGHPQAVAGTVGVQCDGQVGGPDGYDESLFFDPSWHPAGSV